MARGVLALLFFVAVVSACPTGWKESPDGCQLHSADSADSADGTQVQEMTATEVAHSDENPDLTTAEEVVHVDSSETTTMQLTEGRVEETGLQETDVVEEDVINEDGFDETETEPSVDGEEMDADVDADELEIDESDRRSAGATEESDLFEGDITLTDAQRDFLMSVDTSENKKAKADLSSRWPKGIIFYEIPREAMPMQAKILQAIRHYQDKTCLRFFKFDDMEKRKLAGHNYRIQFVRRSGSASSSVGIHPSGITKIALSDRAVLGNVVHEIGHAVGLWHEQSRPDRDKFVRVHFENIKAGRERNFQKYDTKEINNYNVPYDVGSIMHYGPKAFSKNNKLTIEAIDPKQQSKMGQRIDLSEKDIRILRAMYSCRASDVDNECPLSSKCLNGGVLNSRCKCSCEINFFGNRCEHSRRKCGGVINGRTSGVIDSPKDLSHPTMQCDWTILAGPNDVIHLSVEDFAVGQKEQCQRSSVTIDDGNKPQTLCGSKDDVPVKFQSAVGRMGISFADGSKRRKGAFQLRFNVEHAQPLSDPVVMEGRLTRPRSAKCGSTIHAINNGAVLSPNYPKPYDNNVDCAWLIEAPAGRHIRLMVDDFEVEYNPTCEWDYVTISGAFVMNRFCGRAENFPRHILSQTNQLLIKFKTDDSKTLKGFKLSYYVV